MTARATKISAQQLIDAAKAPLLNYGKKDWNAVKECITSDFVYDEVSTQRKVSGPDNVLPLWKGWATAFPDSAPTIHSAMVSANSVIIELTWKGTHTGPLELASGTVPATGKRIEFRACNVFEIDTESVKPRLQRQYFDMATMLMQLGLT